VDIAFRIDTECQEQFLEDRLNQNSTTKESTHETCAAVVAGGVTGLSKKAGFSRRHLVAAAAATIAAGQLDLFGFNRRPTFMTDSTALAFQETSSDKTEVRRFHVNVPEAELTDLRRRINATKWPEKELVADTSQGVQLVTVQKLARYWTTDYHWRRCEAKLNALPQFITEIDGLEIHFIHVRSKHENALPIIITHGWPGSIIEQLKVIDPLVNPTALGGSAEDAFDVVIPSLPGYGFSGKPTSPGWTHPALPAHGLP